MHHLGMGAMDESTMIFICSNCQSFNYRLSEFSGKVDCRCGHSFYVLPEEAYDYINVSEPTDSEKEWARVTMPGKAEGHLEGWKVCFFTKGFIHSFWGNTPWPHFRPLIAKNLSKINIANIIPGPGIYAAKNRFVDRVSDTVLVMKVALWGEVLEHDNGYRGRIAYPLKAYTENPEHAEQIEENYGIPCLMISINREKVQNMSDNNNIINLFWNSYDIKDAVDWPDEIDT